MKTQTPLTTLSTTLRLRLRTTSFRRRRSTSSNSRSSSPTSATTTTSTSTTTSPSSTIPPPSINNNNSNRSSYASATSSDISPITSNQYRGRSLGTEIRHQPSIADLEAEAERFVFGGDVMMLGLGGVLEPRPRVVYWGGVEERLESL